MEIHHGKHHQAYVTNLNAAIEGAGPREQDSGTALLFAERRAEMCAAVRQRRRPLGHTFWELMGPNAGGAPGGSWRGDQIGVRRL
jgi:Fe-Mn family superoxide dismutase